MIRQITDFLLRGRLEAMGIAFVLGFIPVLSIVSVVIALLITLRKGLQEGALVIVAATLPVLISYASMPTLALVNSPVSLYDIVIIVVIVNVTSWGMAAILRQTLSWAMVLEITGLIAIAVICVLHIIYPDMQEWWRQWLMNYFSVMTNSAKSDEFVVFHADIVNVIQGIKTYATGCAAIIICCYSLVELVIARGWQAKVFNPGGLRKELLAIRMSYAASIVFVIVSVLALLNNKIALDCMPVLYGLFPLAGLSVLHYSVKVTKKSIWWLRLAYAILLTFPQTMWIIAFVALLDSGFDFRKRLDVNYHI